MTAMPAVTIAAMYESPELKVILTFCPYKKTYLTGLT